VPEGAGLGQFGEFGAVAGLRRFLPGGDGAVVLDLFQSAEHGLVGEVEKLFAAQDNCCAPSCSRRSVFGRLRGNSARSSAGTSLKKSCSCRFFVPVEMMTRLPERITGKR
jgi:hypothetical protein